MGARGGESQGKKMRRKGRDNWMNGKKSGIRERKRAKSKIWVFNLRKA
jgi:hypothetical protein